MPEDDKGGKGGQQGGQGGQGADGSGQITVDINGETKTLKADDIKVLAGQASELQKLKEQFAPFNKVLMQYGVDSDSYLRNSEAAFALANQLIEAGVIDQEGNILAKGTGEPGKGGTPEAGGRKVVLPEGGENKGLAVVLDALQKISGRIEQLEDGQSGIYRRNIDRDTFDKHPNLTREDVTKLLAKAKADKSKTYWDHAEAMSKEKAIAEKGAQTGIAKKVVETLVKAGIIPEGKLDVTKLDLEALEKEDRNDVSSIYKDKKFVFPHRLKRLKGAGVDVSGFANPTDGLKEMASKRFSR